jgi:hypothetical protein
MPVKKRGGPNTPEGKDIGSKNALKYGFYSNTTLPLGKVRKSFLN